jgi:hypothetical protein
MSLPTGPRECPNCKGIEFEWGIGKRVAIAPHGRLTANDVNTTAFLYCIDCDETVETVDDSDVIADALNVLRRVLREVNL